MTNLEAETILRNLLLNEEFNLSPFRQPGELGVDILAQKGSTVLHIECIGCKKSKPARSRDFFEAYRCKQ